MRAELLTAGWVIRPLDPPHCTASACTYFSQADLKVSKHVCLYVIEGKSSRVFPTTSL